MKPIHAVALAVAAHRAHRRLTGARILAIGGITAAMIGFAGGVFGLDAHVIFTACNGTMLAANIGAAWRG